MAILQHVLQHVQISLSNFASAKLRTLLAMLGILVGTASVVALVSSGHLATQQALQQVSSLGTNLISASIFASDTASPGADQSQNKFQLKTALGVKKASPAINEVAPYVTLFVPIAYEGKTINSSVIGVTDELKDTIGIKMLKGRFISFLDNYNFYCVIGTTIYQQLLAIDNTDPIGKQILLGNNLFTIVGIIDQWPENSFFDQDINNSILVPIGATSILSKYADINNLIILLHPGSNIPAVENAVTQYMNKHAKGKNVFFRSAKELIDSIVKQREILTLLLGLIGTISLLVGGIGIMNIMLVTVVERRREIGIRRALGAKQRDIQFMFLTESIILSIAGGAAGVITGIGASLIIAEFAHWQFAVFLYPPLIGFSVSVLIGVFFGFYPAYQASRLDPIEALHAEV